MERIPEAGHNGGHVMSDVVARIEAALQRSEAAVERLGQRNRLLRTAARDAVAGLDRVIRAERLKRNG